MKYEHAPVLFRIENIDSLYEQSANTFKVAVDGFTLPDIDQRTFLTMTMNLYYYETG